MNIDLDLNKLVERIPRKLTFGAVVIWLLLAYVFSQTDTSLQQTGLFVGGAIAIVSIVSHTILEWKYPTKEPTDPETGAVK